MNLIELVNCEMIILKTKKKIEELSESVIKNFDEAKWDIHDFLELWLLESRMNLNDFFVTEETNREIFHQIVDTLNSEGVSFSDDTIYNLMEDYEYFIPSETIEFVSSSISKNSLIFIADESIDFEYELGEYEMYNKITPHNLSYYKNDKRYSLKQGILYSTQYALEDFFEFNDYDFENQEEQAMYKDIIQTLDSKVECDVSLDSNVSLEQMIDLSSSDTFYEMFTDIFNFLEEWFETKETFFNDLLKVGELITEGRTSYIDSMVNSIVHSIIDSQTE